jgi:hypothetical protein
MLNSTTDPTRQARLDAIRAAATARALLGQAATHEVVDGRHVVTLRGQRFTGDTLDDAIQSARRITAR